MKEIIVNTFNKIGIAKALGLMSVGFLIGVDFKTRQDVKSRRAANKLAEVAVLAMEMNNWVYEHLNDPDMTEEEFQRTLNEKQEFIRIASQTKF